MNTQRLRSTLAASLGQVLTPDLAASIELACWPIDAPPWDVAPMECCSHVLAVERVADVLPELHELHLLHWQETEKYRHGLPFQPDYEAVLASERAGHVVQFTARKAGRMVGNLRVYLQTSRHTGTRFAKEDTLFVHPGHRGGWLAMHLLRYAETVLKGLGVREIRADSKLSNRADVLMRRMGYEPVSTQFVKFF